MSSIIHVLTDTSLCSFSDSDYHGFPMLKWLAPPFLGYSDTAHFQNSNQLQEEALTNHTIYMHPRTIEAF